MFGLGAKVRLKSVKILEKENTHVPVFYFVIAASYQVQEELRNNEGNFFPIFQIWNA